MDAYESVIKHLEECFLKFPAEYKVGGWLVTPFNFMGMDIKEQMRLERGIDCVRDIEFIGRKKKKERNVNWRIMIIILIRNSG